MTSELGFGPMLIVRATRKLLGRLGPVTADAGQGSTTLLGDWHATAWFWRSQVALLVSETTLLPVLLPLAPAATFPQRFGLQLTAVLAAHCTPAEFLDAELREWTRRSWPEPRAGASWAS